MTTTRSKRKRDRSSVEIIEIKMLQENNQCKSSFVTIRYDFATIISMVQTSHPLQGQSPDSADEGCGVGVSNVKLCKPI